MKRKLLLFLAQTKRHIESYSSLNPKNSEAVSVLVDLTGIDKVDTSSFSNIKKVNISKSKLGKTRGYGVLAKELDALWDKFDLITIYYTSIDNLLVNHVFFNKNIANKTKYICVEDGILNYYSNHSLFVSNGFIKQLLKKVVVPFFGLKYSLYSNSDITGVSYEKVKAIYLTYPLFSMFSSKALQLPIKSNCQIVERNSELALIIGQEPEIGVHGAVEYIKSINSILAYLSNKGVKSVLYKSHPRSNSKERQLVLANFPQFVYGFDNFDLLNIELNGQLPYYIGSINSSALFTLKSVLGNEGSEIIFCNKFIECPTSHFFLEIGLKQLQ